VAFIPGRAFCAAGGVRLNYSHPAPDEIRDGIRRLGQVLCLRNAVLPPTGLSLVTGQSAPIDRLAALELE